jgi:hypothetical protein
VFTQDQLALFAQRCLMVAGGFAAGYLLTWVAGVGFDKVVVKGTSPAFLHKWARVIGGLVVAFIVAFFVFRGGTGGGDGTGSGDGTGPATNSTWQQTGKTPPTDKLPEVAVEAVAVKVGVFAGNAVERGTQKFFSVNGGGMVELGEVAAAVRQQKAANKAGVVIVYTLDDTANEGTQAFQILRAEAKALGVPMVSEEQFRQLRK